MLTFESTNHKFKIFILSCDAIFHCLKYARIRDFTEPIFRYKDRIVDSVLIWENTGQWKSILWHFLRSVFPTFCKMFLANFLKLICYFDYDQTVSSNIEFQIHLRWLTIKLFQMFCTNHFSYKGHFMAILVGFLQSHCQILWKLRGKQVWAFSDNPSKNIWRIKKSSNIRQDQKTLISTFAQSLISARESGHYVTCLQPNLRFL